MKNLCFLIVLAVAIALSACNGKDVAKVKPGMTGGEVEAAIGKPDQKIDLPFNMAWWKYGKNQMLAMRNDSVVTVITDAKKFAEEMQQNMTAGLKAAEEASQNLSDMDTVAEQGDTATVDNTATEVEQK